MKHNNGPNLFVISLWAEDVLKTVHFYRDVIGLKLLPHSDHRPHFDLGDCFLVILQGKTIPVQNPVPARFPSIAFTVADLDHSISKLLNHHVELPWDVEEDTDYRWVMFYDPGGNLIELAQHK